MISKNNENEDIKKKLKDNYKVIRTFNKNGPAFQEVMEKILIMKLNDLDKINNRKKLDKYKHMFYYVQYSNIIEIIKNTNYKIKK